MELLNECKVSDEYRIIELITRLVEIDTANTFFLIVLYTLLFAAVNTRDLYLRFAGEE